MLNYPRQIQSMYCTTIVSWCFVSGFIVTLLCDGQAGEVGFKLTTSDWNRSVSVSVSVFFTVFVFVYTNMVGPPFSMYTELCTLPCTQLCSATMSLVWLPFWLCFVQCSSVIGLYATNSLISIKGLLSVANQVTAQMELKPFGYTGLWFLAIKNDGARWSDATSNLN